MLRSSAAMLCILLVSCQTKKSASLHIDPELESLVPADTVFIAGASVDSIRQTPVYQKLLPRLNFSRLDEFARQTGLDPRKDLSQILSCWDGKQGLLMARGKFQKKDLEARLESKGAARSTYKNYSLFGNEQNAVVLLNDSTVIAGPPNQLRSIIDRGQAGSGLPPALAELLRTLPADDQIYTALIGGLEELSRYLPQGGNVGNFIQSLQSVDTAAAGINLSGGLNLIAHINSKTDRDAKFIHDMLKGLVGFGRLNLPDNQPELLKLYDAIQINQQETQTEVKADVTADQVNRFLDLYLKR